MKPSFSIICLRISLLFLCIFSFLTGFSQENTNVIESYATYSKLPREIAYVHLNKSIYIKGECIGFSAYILDKNTKKPSSITTNLYCTVSNKDRSIVKSQMIKVNNGYAVGTFDVNEDFTSGDYTFMAYTNWMKNFDEQNIFVESIKIIDPETDNIIKSETIENNLDAQFLPEGGHLVADIQNTIGIVVKNTEGFGVPQITGEILDNTNTAVSSFKTNDLGIGRVLLTPIIGQSYTAKIEHLGKTFNFNISDIKPRGIALSLTDLGKNVAIKLSTNTSTLSDIKNNTYKLAIHNGNEMKVIDFGFENLDVLKLIKKQDLNPGINIFTVFDKTNKPLLERLYFNHDKVNIRSVNNPKVTKDFDSLKVSFSVNKLSANTKHNMSVSVLHSDTKSYGSHQNIASYTLLQPYVNGYIENGAYYFQNIDRKKKYELDNLLITQGWSSYDWNTIFNKPPTNTFVFENGIGFQANINSKKSNQFLMFALRESKGDVFVVGDSEKSFIKTGLFPSDNEKLNIGEINSKGKMDEPNLYIQFSPSKIPEYINSYKVLKPNSIPYTVATQIQPFASSILDGTQELDEVLIEAKREETRMEQLERRAAGTLDFFDDRKRRSNRTLAQYLSRKGFVTSDYGGILTITVRNPLTPNNTTPVVYLNGSLLSDFGFLATFDMNSVDYIEINKSGVGEGMRGGAGVIKLWTDPNIQFRSQYGENYKDYEFPLTFSKAKTFYTPKYNFYKSQFFKEYGVVGWKPKVVLDTDGIARFQVFDTSNDYIKIFVEGIDNDGNFIIDEKIITVN
ncbi:hypothetical protein [Psychroserpens algicola]|uniref:hypothetical protein n=1 Tax=Psychroserpens algicola TaxID=1719034 RepID=UPI001954F89C|nr:hypothetical protein [Psychroserpens algicola]